MTHSNLSITCSDVRMFVMFQTKDMLRIDDNYLGNEFMHVSFRMLHVRSRMLHV